MGLPMNLLVGLIVTIELISLSLSTVPCDFNQLCSCSNTINPIREVNCLGLPITKLPRLPSNLTIYRFTIINSPDLEHLQPNALGSSEGISSLVIKRCRISSIAFNAFNGSQLTLTTLDLSYNELTEVPLLPGLQSLQWLSFRSNRLTQLKVKDWRSLFIDSNVTTTINYSDSELRSLIISDNLLTLIPDGIFNQLVNLQSLDLDNNRISSLEGKPFPSTLTSLSLANNLLEKIPIESLWNLNRLKWLTLRGNLIVHLPYYWPLPVITIELIDLSHNLLTTLSGNFFTSLSNKIKSTNQPYFQPQRAINGKQLRMMMVKNDSKKFTDQQLTNPVNDNLLFGNNQSELIIHIRELLLDYNLITTISDNTFQSPIIIERLSLANNQLNNLPDNLFTNSLLINRLRVFDISFNPMINFNSDQSNQLVSGLNRVTNLLFRGIKLTSIQSTSLANCSTELQMIDLSSNQLQSIPSSALSLTRKLLRLNLADNQIKSVDFDSLGKWSVKLLSLSLSKNGLQFISPKAFRNTINLRELKLGLNNLLTVNNQFLTPLASSLTILELSYSIMSSQSKLLETIKSMVKLELLELDNNRLIDYQSIKLIKETPSLVHIDLDGNSLINLPSNTFNGSYHTKLRNIVLSSNKLFTIESKTFNSLGQLVTIDLRGNQLQSISDYAFNNLPMLQTLILSRNQLGKLDSKPIIVNCSNLINIHLQENQLTSVDLSFLNSVHLNGNNQIVNKSLINSFGINLNLSHNQLIDLFISDVDLITTDIYNSEIINQTNLVSNSLQQLVSSSPQIPTTTTTATATIIPGIDLLQLTNETINNFTNESVTTMMTINSESDSPEDNLSNNLPAADEPSKSSEKKSKSSKQLPIRSVDCSYNQLNQLNINLSKALGGNLINLNLNHNRLKYFPLDSLNHLPSLMSLSLSNNIISQLTESPPSSSSSSSSSPPQVNPLTNQNQTISSTPTPTPTQSTSSQLPNGYHCCPNLIYLDLSYNNLTFNNLSDQLFSSMINLMILDLSFNNIYNLPENLFNGTKVSKLNLKGNHLSSLTLQQSTNHQNNHHHYQQNHHHHQHQSLPDQLIVTNCLGISSTLTHLDLSYNHLQSIPVEINSCHNLIHLNMKSNHLHSFHESLMFVSTFKQLTFLDISSNQVNHNPNYHHNHHHHRYINDLTKSKHQQLTTQRKGLTNQIVNLPDLKYLYWSNCSLTNLPTIKSNNLIFLDVSHNQLTNLPSSLLNSIPNLLHFDLSSNQLTVVPEELGISKLLITLILSFNPISNLDSSSFTPFKQLKSIDIRGLSLRYIDIRMFNSLRYLTDLKTSTYPRVRSFRLTDLLSKSIALRSALIQVDEATLSHQIQYAFGSKLRELVITGHQLVKILPDAFLGLHHQPDMILRIVDTNISSLPSGLLRYINDIRHITIDLRRNQLTQFKLNVLQSVNQESPMVKGSLEFNVFPFSSNGLTISGGLLLEDNPLICSCDILWLSSWLRKWLKESRKIHHHNHDTFLSTESKARLMTCKQSIVQLRKQQSALSSSIISQNNSIISINLRPKAKLISDKKIPLLDIYPEDIGCNSVSTNVNSPLAQLFLLLLSIVYQFIYITDASNLLI